MSKISVTLDASALRQVITKKEYTNKQGEKVSQDQVKFELIPVKDEQIVYETDSYALLKTHFAVKVQTKEERDRKDKPVYLGEGIKTLWKNKDKDNSASASQSTSEAPNAKPNDDLPF